MLKKKTVGHEESLRQLRDRAQHFMQISKVVTGEAAGCGNRQPENGDIHNARKRYITY